MRDSDPTRRGSDEKAAFQDRDEPNGDPLDAYELADILEPDAFLGFLKVVGEHHAVREEISDEMIVAAATRASEHVMARVHRLNEIGIPIHILQRLKRAAPPRSTREGSGHDRFEVVSVDDQHAPRPVFLDSYEDITLYADSAGGLYVLPGHAESSFVGWFGVPSECLFSGYLHLDRIGLGHIEEALQLVCAHSAVRRGS